MRGFIKTIENIWSIKELREKLLFTFGLLLVYRFASYVLLPGLDGVEIDAILDRQVDTQGDQGILGLLNSFTGGALSRGSIMALGIMPYITASIIIQLAGMAVPYIQKLQKEGDSGRKRITQLTRWLTIAICLVQAPAYLTLLTQQLLPYGGEFNSAYLYAPTDFWFYFPATIILVSGTIFAMWLGEKITDRGIGNGISILIMIGILADFPRALINSFNLDNSGGFVFTLIVVGLLVAILLSVVLVNAVRRIPVQYVRRAAAGGGGGSNYMKSVTNAVRSYIPLKVNAAGVMPIIFAQAIMFLPGAAAGLVGESNTVIAGFLTQLANPFSLVYNVVFAVMIILFTFFYTAITIQTNQMADDLKRNGGIIPGIKPGKDTAEYLDDILSKITLPGSLFLAFLAILPALVRLVGVDQGMAIFFGGTSLLIMVGVILDTVQQINTYLLNHHYDGLMQSGRTSKKVA